MVPMRFKVGGAPPAVVSVLLPPLTHRTFPRFYIDGTTLFRGSGMGHDGPAHGGAMLTRLRISNFRRFSQADVELASPVVFLGPNNSGKSAAMQALVLWEAGLRRWLEKRPATGDASKGRGVILSQRDLAPLAVPKANLLWHDLRVRNVLRRDGRQFISNVRIEVTIEGTVDGMSWACGLEFDYANEESIYCRPLRTDESGGGSRMLIPEEASTVRTAYLGPVARIAPYEVRLASGAIALRLSQGRTAEVLRNLCLNVLEEQPENWQSLANRISNLFGIELDPPRHRSTRGEITMMYREGGSEMEISAAGRGVHQILLPLAYMYACPSSVLLLDAPDAHLEPLRQRQAYRMIREVSRDTDCQAIVATHSKIFVGEAADHDAIVAFLGQPRRVAREHWKRISRSLKEIGLEHFLLAQQRGWVLYLGGPTDLSVLQGFARVLGHDSAQDALQRPFVHYVSDSAEAAYRHFGLIASVLPSCRGLALLSASAASRATGREVSGMTCLGWRRGHIEEYVCVPAALEAYAVGEAQSTAPGPLFAFEEADRRLVAMREAIRQHRAGHDLGGGAGEDSLTSIFREYQAQLDLTDSLPLPDIGELAETIAVGDVEPEVRDKLDAIASLAEQAGSVGTD